MAGWRSRRGRPRVLRWILAGLLVAALALAAGLLAKRPRGDRDWGDYAARTATATRRPDGSLVLHNVRDWTYSDRAVLSSGWTERTVDPAAVTGVFFLLEPIPGAGPMAHTFLSFRFKDGSGVSFSVEARLVKGESWKPLRGAMRNYELAYQWGTERDFIAGRVVRLRDHLRLYPVLIKAETAQRLFVDLIEETNALARRPRFYNTLTDNCTNTLAYIVNRHHPGALPWSPSWYLTADADAYLMRQGFIAMDGGSIDRTRTLHDLEPYRAKIAAMAGDAPDRFSAELAALPPARAAAPP